MNVYLVAEIATVLERPVPGSDLLVRPISEDDVLPLAALYQRAYADEAPTLPDAIKEMRSAFDGTWGELCLPASPAAWLGDRPVGVVQTVTEPTWDAPRCPWIIEVFTDPDHRQQGLARTLLAHACRALVAEGHGTVGLTVDESNTPAWALYRSLGFEVLGS